LIPASPTIAKHQMILASVVLDRQTMTRRTPFKASSKKVVIHMAHLISAACVQ
jgi:hypothetical protein